MPSPCFAQEFAPTSVAFAEVQSMFLDSIIGDADWQTRYATTAAGEPMPFGLIEKAIRASQPFAAHGLRAMFTVPYCEKAIYEIPDDELTAGRVLDEIAAVERRMLGMERSSRPALSVPHLLAGESSAEEHLRSRTGVLGMRERVAPLGGTVELSDPDDGGAQLVIRLPVAPPADSVSATEATTSETPGHLENPE